MLDPLFDLTGKVALVTGGSRGLGYQMVKAFAERGADVIIASRKLDACEAVANEVRALGRRALAVAVHAAKWDSIDALIDTAYAQFGRVDILVNNAGMSPRVPSHEVSEALFDSVLGLNFKGPFRLASQIGKRMADGAGGVIINISSTGALMPLPQVVPYSAAKAALNAMTVSLAREYGPKVRVNTISAGPFRLASQVAKRMFDGDGGTIINISSTASLNPAPQVVTYGGAKAALNSMTESLAREYGPKVRVNVICPGPFLTDIAKAWTEEARESANNALGRPGLPEEIVTAALFLASPASSFTTGALIRVDGGH